MPRLFIAIPVPARRRFVEALEVLERLRPWTRPVHRDQLHLTLRFLGEVGVERIDAVATAIDAAVASAGPIEPISFDRLDTLPPQPSARPRVVIAAATAAPALDRLALTLDNELARLDPPLPPRDKPFRTHLTLARLKPGRRTSRAQRDRLHALLDAPAADPTVVRLESVALIESDLTPSGPRYATRHARPLPRHG